MITKTQTRSRVDAIGEIQIISAGNGITSAIARNTVALGKRIMLKVIVTHQSTEIADRVNARGVTSEDSGAMALVVHIIITVMLREIIQIKNLNIKIKDMNSKYFW